MYTLSDIWRGLRNPRAAGRELNRLVYRARVGGEFNDCGTNFLEEDWDNLLILDACRYDTFTDLAELPGDTDHRISRGAATYEFVRANFSGRHLHDTVYVGANTWFLKLQDEIDAEIHDFIDLQHGDNGVEFVVEELDVPHPESVTAAARDADERYPKKRLIIHYLQPHHPFIGPKGSRWFTHQSSSLTEVIDQSPDATRERVREAYRENLELVLPEVRALLQTLSGRTVVTADHGEMLGERHQFVPTRDYGHHEGIYNDALVKVPWHIVPDTERKKIVAEEPKDRSVDPEAVDERLRDLGYVV